MNRGRGGIRNTADDAVVVVEGDAFASLDLQTVCARIGKDNSQHSRSLLVLDDDADSPFGGGGNHKGGAGRSANRNSGVGKFSKKWR